MDDNIRVPSSNVLPFAPEQRRKASRDGGKVAADSCDHGPSPEESLRIMRAFVGIKNRELRADLIEMLEGATRTRGQAPNQSKD